MRQYFLPLLIAFLATFSMLEGKMNPSSAETIAVTEKQKGAEEVVESGEESDLCGPIRSFIANAPTHFKNLKGAYDEEASEMEDEDIYQSSEDLPGFRKGLIMPTYMGDNMRLYFASNAFESMAAAQEELKNIKGELDPCFNNVDGFTGSEDSGIHFYKKGKLVIAFGTKKDMNDDGDDIDIVWLSVQQN